MRTVRAPQSAPEASGRRCMSDGRPRKPQHLRPSRAPYSYPDEAATEYPESSGPDRSPRNSNDPERILAPARPPEPAPGRGNSPGPVPVRGRLPRPGAAPGAVPGRGRLPEPGAGPGAAPGAVPGRGRLPEPGAALEPVPGRAREPGRRRAHRSARRRPRRGRWLAVGLVAVLGGVAAAAVAVGVFSSNGPAHVLMTPAKLGAYVRRPQLEQQVGAKQLQREVTAKSAGQARHVIYAVYEDSAGGADGKTPQIMLFIGGNLSGTSPGDFISSFTSQSKGATLTSAGSLGGEAACVSAQASVPGSVALCTWADNDTFGVVASPAMNVSQLAALMRAIRPSVEHVAK